jgi:hypothetical protein
MTRKLLTLIAVAVLLGGASIYFNTDWFAPDDIHIIHRSRPARGGFLRRRADATATTDPVMFGLDRRLKLKAVKVVPVYELETNKYPHALWSLISDSNSVPVKTFYYGIPIQGMRPEYKGKLPEPLQPQVKYRLFIEADGKKAEHDFEPVPRSS